MNTIDELIAKAADGTLSAAEQHEMEAACVNDPSLESAIAIEHRITSVLKADAAMLEAEQSNTTPGAPLLQYISSSQSSPAPKKAAFYYGIGAAACLLLAILAYISFRPNNNPAPIEPPVIPPTVTAPALQQPEQPAPTTSSSASDMLVAPTNKKDTIKKKTIHQQTPKQHDLDGELSTPPVFVDPKGHMPINNNH